MTEALFYIRKDKQTELVCCKISNDETEIVDIVITNNNELVNYDLISQVSEIDFEKTNDFENELFFHYYIKYITHIDCLFKKYYVEKVRFIGNNKYLNYIRSYCIINRIQVKPNFNQFKTDVYLVFSFLSNFIVSLLGAVYTVFYAIIKSNKTVSKEVLTSSIEFSLIHSKTSYNKLHNVLNENILYYYDSYKLDLPDDKRHYSFYSILGRKDLIKNIFVLPFETIILFRKTFISSKKLLGFNGAILSMNFFAKRIPHFILIKRAYLKLFKNSNSKIFYSGERESRYGLIAMKLRDKNKIKAVCIPHGIAYAYLFPLGVFGDLFYSTSENEAKFLSKQYISYKYIFDRDVVSKMFSFNKKNESKKVIFFTEPRKISVNIEIIKALIKSVKSLRIKLHPDDDNSNYSQFKDIEFVDDFIDSISGNICLARKSTILIEALYNNSTPVAILFDKDDKFDFENMFPSLRSNGIIKVYNNLQLEKVIKKFTTSVKLTM